MAADRDIVLNVGMNASEVKQKSTELNAEIQDIFKNVDSSKASESFQRILIQMNKMSSASAKLQASLQEAESTSVTTKEYDSLTKKIDTASSKVNTLESEYKELNEEAEKLKNVTVPTKEYTKLQTELTKTEAAVKDLFEEYQEVRNIAVDSKEYVTLQNEIAKTTEKLNKLKDARTRFLAIGGDKKSRTFKGYQYDIEETTKSLAQLKADLQDLKAEGQDKEVTPELEKVGKKLTEVTLKYKKLEAAAQSLRDEGKAEVVTPELDKISDKLENVKSQLEEAQKAKADFIAQRQDLVAAGRGIVFGEDTKDYAKDLEALNELNNEIVRYLGKAQAAGEVDFSRPTSSMNKLLDATVKVGTAFARLSMTTAAKGLLKVANMAAKAVTQLTKLAGASIRNGISKLSGSLNGLGKSSGSADKFFKHAFSNIIRYGFGVRSFYFLVRKLRTALIEGFGDLAKVSDPFNVAVSNILTALRLLRNSFASAFSPLIEVVSPILTHFINQMAEAVNKIGMLIAALTGQQTYMRALPVYQDYAASLDKSSKNADKASKSTKKLKNESEKLKKTLAGFDDVEILKGPDDDNGDDGGLDDLADALDGLTDAEQSFMRVPLGELFTNLSDLLKKAWADADFTEIGRILGEKLLAALNKIPWEKIKNFARKLGKSLATLINGFVSVDGLFLKLGETIAESINTLFEFLYAFASNLEWAKVGKAIKDGILGIVGNIDWDLIKSTFAEFGRGIGTLLQEALNNPEIWIGIFNTFANALNVFIVGVHEFINAVEWGDLGTNIATGLNHAVETFSWDEFTQTLIDGINGAFDLWYNFVTTFEWDKFGTKIGTSVANAVNGINWREGAASVAETLNGLLSALNAFFDEINSDENGGFKNIGHKIAEAIATFLNTFNWEAFGTFISNCIIALLDLILAVVDYEDEQAGIDNIGELICTKIGEALLAFNWYDIASKMLQLFASDFVRALLMMPPDPGRDMARKVKDMSEEEWNSYQAKLAKDGFIDPFSENIRNEADYNRKLREAGEHVAEGLKEGTVDNWDKIDLWAEKHISEPFIDGTNKAFDSHSPSRKMLPVGENVAEGLKQGITDDWQDINSWTDTNIFSTFNSALISTFNIVGNSSNAIMIIGESAVNGFKEGLTNNWYTVVDWATESAYSLIDVFNNIDWWSIGDNICNGISNGLSNGWNWLTTHAWNLAIDIYNSACNALDIGSPSKLFRDGVGKMIPAGMALGIMDNEGLVENAMDNLTNTVTNNAKQALEIPAVVKGAVIPYQATISNQTESSLQDIVKALDYNYSDKITSSDLEDIIVRVIEAINGIDFYIGDEQIARHNNQGNLKLNRRYNKLRYGEAY